MNGFVRRYTDFKRAIAEQGDAGPPLPGGGLEVKFGAGITGGGIWGWFRIVFDPTSTALI